MRAVFAVVAAVALPGSMVPALAQEGAHPIVEIVADPALLHCIRPNVRRKTCQSIETFEPINEGVYYNVSLIAAGNGAVVEFQTPVWLGQDAFCGTVREQDMMTATVRVNGREVHPSLAQGALAAWVRENRALLDQEFCTWYERSGADFVAKSSIGGVHRPEFDVPVKIVSRADGYRAG